MANTLRNASAPASSIITDRDGVTGAEVVSSAPVAGQTGLVVYPVPSAAVTPTQDGADGTVGATAPTIAIEIGAVDANGKLQHLNVDSAGNLLVSSTGSSSSTTASTSTADGTVALGSEKIPLNQLPGTDFNEQATYDTNLAQVFGTQPIQGPTGRIKVDNLPTDVVFQGSVAATRTTFAVPCAGYATATVQLGGTWTGTVTFEGVASGSATTANDPVLSVAGVNPQNLSLGQATTATANAIFRFTVSGLSRFQVRFSTATSGSPQVSITLSQQPSVNIITVGNVASVTASRTVGAGGAAMDAVINTGAAPANALWTESAPATAAAAALSVSAQATLTVVNVKATAGNVYGCSVQNPNASTIFIQFYNTSGTPTLGTSVIWWLPVGASATVFFGGGSFALANFATGIGIGAATTATGAVAPGSAPAVVVHYL